MKNIKMILFDIDNTLVFGERASSFYLSYSRILEKTLSESLKIDLEEGKKIADEHRRKFNGHGELAFVTHGLGMEKWYEKILSLNPKKNLNPIPATNNVLEFFKKRGLIIGAVTDGPSLQAERILSATKIERDLLSFCIGWEKGQPMPKGGSEKIYQKLCREFDIIPSQAVMIGDSLHSDILPAIKAGLKAIHISDKRIDGKNKWTTVENIQLLTNLRKII